MIYLIFIFSMLPNFAWAADTLNPPTVFSTERLMIVSFVFIVALEAWIFAKRLPGLSTRRYIYTSVRANLITIFMVVPIVWGIWFVLMRTIPESYLMPIYNETLGLFLISPWTGNSESLLWAEWRMVPVYFIASYYVEYWFCYETFTDFEKKSIKKAFLLANLASYILIMILETLYWIFYPPEKIL